MVISAMWRRFSAERITCVSNVPRIFWIFSSPPSTCLRVIGVISYWRPVYSTFIDALLKLGPTESRLPVLWKMRHADRRLFNVYPRSAGSDVATLPDLALHSPLMRARYFHVFAILCYCAPRYLDALRLQHARDLVIGERMCRIFFFNQFLYATLQNQ